jgi:hypothetical protein
VNICAREFNLDGKSAYISKDLRLDFKHNSGLVFCDFYDSIFELLDNIAGSKSLIEYLSLAKLVKAAVKTSDWYPQIRPPLARHYVSRKQFHNWMKEHMGDKEFQKLENLCNKCKNEYSNARTTHLSVAKPKHSASHSATQKQLRDAST